MLVFTLCDGNICTSYAIMLVEIYTFRLKSGNATYTKYIDFFIEADTTYNVHI
jgi:hypothetical protein